jgi:hypothetical protein
MTKCKHPCLERLILGLEEPRVYLWRCKVCHQEFKPTPSEEGETLSMDYKNVKFDTSDWFDESPCADKKNCGKFCKGKCQPSQPEEGKACQVCCCPPVMYDYWCSCGCHKPPEKPKQCKLCKDCGSVYLDTSDCSVKCPLCKPLPPEFIGDTIDILQALTANNPWLKKDVEEMRAKYLPPK